ncbi:DEAD/DEAH box helicase family protein [Rhodococcus sp. BH2-1]|nr:DEAD/DEAH box helicase family protein [Rhodococcus sp. BH2-1]
MLEHRGLPEDLLDARITKGQADTAIKSLIAGDTAAIAAPQPVAAEPDPADAVVEAITAVDYDVEVRDLAFDAVRADTDITAAVSTPVNSYDQFKDWAGSRIQDLTIATLVDIADAEDVDEELSNAARTLLADPTRLDAVRRELTEDIWAEHAADRGTATASESEDRPETEVDRQERVQREQAESDAAEVTDWQRRGRDAFDPADPLAPAGPAADPVAAEVLSTVRARSKTAIELREQYTHGYDQARRAYLDPVAAAILRDEVAAAPEVVAAVDGRGPNELWFQKDFVHAVQTTAAGLDDRGDLTRRAAIALIVDRDSFVGREAAGPAVAAAIAQAGPLPWQHPKDENVWRAFTLNYFRADPVAVAEMRHSFGGGEGSVLAEMIETSLDAFAEMHPDLAAAITDETRPRVEAAIRQELAPAFAADNESRDPAAEELRRSDRGYTLRGRTNYWVKDHMSLGQRQWVMSTDGGGTTTSWGVDHRTAVGALYAADGRTLHHRASAELYREVAEARGAIDARAQQILADHENVHIVAANDLYRNDPAGLHNAIYNSPVNEAVWETVTQLRDELPDHVAVLEQAGLPVHIVLDEDSVKPVLTQAYAEFEGDGGLLARDYPTDVTFTSRTATSAIVSAAAITGPDGGQVELREARRPDRGWVIVGDDDQTPLSFREAVAIARGQLRDPHTLEARLSGRAPEAAPAVAAEAVAEPDEVPSLTEARTVDDYRRYLDATARESFHAGGDYLDELTTHARYALDAALAPASAGLDRQLAGTATGDDLTDALAETVERLTALDTALDEIRAEDRDVFDHAPLTAVAEKIHHGSERSRQSLDGRLAAAESQGRGLASVRSDHAQPSGPDIMVGHIGADPQPVESAVADAISDRYTEATAEPEPEPEPVLQVPQNEHGESLTSPHWRSGTLVPAQRPDGSTVYVSPSTAARYRGEDAEQVPAAGEPDPAPVAEPTAESEPVAEPAASSATAEPGGDFALGADVLAPSAAKQRARANLNALALVASLVAEDRPATADEQRVLAQWSGWGGVPQIFDTAKTEFDAERAELQELLTPREYDAARLSTVNAHYTDPAIAAAMWRAVERAGLPEGARVLEPGCGSGHFLGSAPEGVRMVGVELDPITAQIAHHLYPGHQVRNHGFEAPFADNGAFTATIGNVPFGNYAVYDDVHNPNSRNIHNHFIIKSLNLTAPGGYVAVITSAFTSDAARPDARKDIAELADLVGAVRLPSTAHRRQAATDVLTDVLVFRRREGGRQMSEETQDWLDTWVKSLPGKDGKDTDARINGYFVERPENVLGTYEVGNGMYGSSTLKVIPRDNEPVPLGVSRVLDRIIDQALDNGQTLTAKAPDRTLNPSFDAPGLYTRAVQETAVPGTLRFDERTDLWEQYQVGAGWVATPKKSREINDQWQRLLAMGDTVLEIGEAARDLGSTAEDRQALRDHLGRQYDDYVAEYGFINRFKWTNHATENSPEKTAENFTKLEGQWRIQAARDLAVDRGVDPEELDDLDLAPFDGEMPTEVREALLEQARTPAQGPRKNRYHLQGAISFDPRIAMVRSLELFNDENGTAVKTSIFTEDATLTARVADAASNIDEAIAISVDELGRVDPARMAQLLDSDPATVVDQARGKIFPSLADPQLYELAGEFLSGDIRSKLARARICEAEHPDIYRGVVDALEEVVPAEVDPARIGVRPGADWVGEKIHAQFIAEEFGIPIDDVSVTYAPVSASWKVEVKQPPNWVSPENGYNDTWGIPGRYEGIALFETIANNKPVEVQKNEDELEKEPKPRFHPKHTNDLRNRAVKLEEKFVQWLWSNPQRYDQLKTAYNDRFNRFVTPQFDTSHRQYPGLNSKYRPYEYQRRAVERLLHGETILLDHCVGAGKTLTMTVSSMEMRRLGQVRQPWIVAPNHLVDQWAAEVRDAYPAAKILVGSDLDGFRDRQRFIGQTAVTEWDMVIVPESVFKLIGVTKETEIDYIDTRLMELREGLESAKSAGSDHTIKEIEKAIKREETKQQKLVNSKAADTGLTFEQSGCDFIWVDEAHYYKNLARASNSADLSVVDGAQRASDLEMKARFLRDRAFMRNIEAGRPDAPAKALAFATGTPVSNSMSELWVMNRYLRPDMLRDARVEHIDAWAQTFAKQRTTVEMNVTGTSLRPVSRMAEYQNVGQLMAMVDQFRDVVTEDQIPVQLPRMRTGAPIVVEFDLAPQVRDFMFDLDERMSVTSGKTMDIDNALKIANDGRNASLHPTLAGLPEPDPEHDRIVVAADLIWKTHSENADLFTPADRYGPDAHGVFQMVFCDRGTPKPGVVGDNNLYSRLRDALVERGMAREEVAFIHDYPSPKQKQELFADCRAGKVRVLIGSTPKLGTGVNAQRLLKQLISLDPAWTAADMQQRFGRIIRQGNVHAEVDVVNVVARRSYDATMWQIIERKANAVQQIRSADVPDTMEDVGGDIALSAAQTKAAATGDPVYVQVVEQQAFVDGLESEQTMIANGNASRHAAIERLDRNVQRLDAALPALDDHAAKAAAWLAIEDRGRRTITVAGQTIADNDSESLVAAFQHVLQTKYIDARTIKSDKPIDMFEVGGITVTGRYSRISDVLQLSVTPGGHRYIDHAKAVEAMSSPTAARGIIQQVRNLVKDLPEKATDAHRQLERSIARRDELAAIPDATFTRTEELSRSRYALAELKAEVNARENSPGALADRGHDLDRRRAEGLYPKWSLDLNPTRAHAEKEKTSPSALAESVPERMAAYAEQWKAGEADRAAARAADPWKPRSADGSHFQYGADRDSGQAGASIQWTDRAWHWSAWGPDGSKASDFEDRRDAARYAAEAALKRFEKEPAATSPGQEVDRSADAARDTGHPHDLRTMLCNRAAAKPERDQARRPETDTGRNTGHERGL